MTTKAESDLELATNLNAIADAQSVSFNSTGLYTKVGLVPGSSSLSVTEYKGGGPKVPSQPNRNPGYLICQHAEEDGVQYMRCIDYGTSGRTCSWAQVEINETPS